VHGVSTFMQQFSTVYIQLQDGIEFAVPNQQLIGVEVDIMLEMLSHAYTGELWLADFESPYNVIAAIPNMSDHIIDFMLQQDVDLAEIVAHHTVGAVLDLTLFDVYSWQSTGETVPFHVIGLVMAEDIASYMGNMSVYPMLFTLQDSFYALGLAQEYNLIVLDVDDAIHHDIYRVITQLTAEFSELSIQSNKNMIDEFTRQITGVIVIVLLMLAVVTLNGIMNLAGTTFMSIAQRRKELGVLMAMGLSPRAAGKMLLQEGLWISLFCVVLSTGFGLGLGIGLHQLLVAIGATYLQFSFPVLPLLSLVFVLSIVPYFIIKVAVHRLQKSTIVELLGRFV